MTNGGIKALQSDEHQGGGVSLLELLLSSSVCAVHSERGRSKDCGWSTIEIFSHNPIFQTEIHQLPRNTLGHPWIKIASQCPSAYPGEMMQLCWEQQCGSSQKGGESHRCRTQQLEGDLISVILKLGTRYPLRPLKAQVPGLQSL